MDPDFWHQRWKEGSIAFHEPVPNPLMVGHFNALSLKKGGRVFLPLCGKTLDISWFLSQGYRVAGAELSPIAIEQLFAELKLIPKITPVGELDRYRAENIDIFVGDIFALSGDALGPVNAVYDRAALVAIPETMRSRYAAHLTGITRGASQLLICFEYDQSRMAGPPFSIDDWEIRRLYGDHFDLTLLARVEVPGGLKGKCPAKETAWLLKGK